MSADGVTIDHEHMSRRARQQGITLDRSRAEKLRPKVESLLTRLERLGATLPRGISPPSMPPPPRSRP